MPIDPNVLLGAQPVQFPNPLDIAMKGLSLADLSSRSQLLQNSLMQQQDYASAVQKVGRAMQSGQSFDQIAPQIAQENPYGYAKILADNRSLEYTRAQTQEALAKGQQASAEAFKAGIQSASNIANGIVQKGTVDPMTAQQLLAQTIHAYKSAGIDTTGINFPSVMSSPDTLMNFAKSIQFAGTTPLDATKMDEIIRGNIPKLQADTRLANVQAQYEPYKAETGRISAGASASEAAAKWADLRAPKVEVDPFGRALALNRGIGTNLGPTISLAPTGGAPAAAAPQPGPDLGDQVSRQTGVGGGAAPTVAAQATGTLPQPGGPTAKAIAEYRMAPQARGTPFGDIVMDQVQALNPKYDVALWNAKAKTAEQFTPGSGPGDTVRAQNVAITHIALLQQLSQAMDQNKPQLYNAIKNRIANDAGVAAPNTFGGVADIVGGEIAKAVVPGAGGESERDAIRKRFSGAQTYSQVSDMAEKYQGLLGAQMNGLRYHYNADMDPLKTGESDFDKFVTPETKATLAKVEANLQQQQQGGAQQPGSGGVRVEKRPDPTTLKEGTKYVEDNGNVSVVRNGRWALR